MTTEAVVKETEGKSRIKSSQKFAIYTYLTEHKEQLLQDKPSVAELSKTLTEQFGFEVKGPIIRNAKKDTGIEWRSPHKGNIQGSRLKLSQLAEAVTGLYEKLNLPVPAYLQSSDDETEED